MTKPGRTAFAMVLDQSGSMYPIRDDTIGAVNTFIEDQKQVPGELLFSLTLFDTKFENRYTAVPVAEVGPLTPTTYKPHGATALYDAVGNTINALGMRLESVPEDERPEKVVVVIQTDGKENSSREFSAARVKAMIGHQRETYGWEFLFLGVDQDAWLTGRELGIDFDHTLSSAPGQQGKAYGLTSEAVRSFRTGASSTPSYDNSDIRDDAGQQK